MENKDVIKNNDDKNPDVIDRLCRFAFIMATLGIVSLFLFVIDIILLVVFKSKFKA